MCLGTCYGEGFRVPPQSPQKKLWKISSITQEVLPLKLFLIHILVIPVAARYNMWVCEGSLDGIADSNPACVMGVFECCQVQISATGSSLDRKCPTHCSLPECGSYNKTTRCTYFSNLFLEQNSTCFGQFLCPSSGVFHCTHSNGICHTGLLTACSQAVSKPV